MMTKENEKLPNVPNLRFSDDYWNNYIFLDNYDIANGLNKDKASFGFGFPIVNYMDVNKHAFLSKSMIKGLVNTTKKERKIFAILPQDVLITRTSETKQEIAYSSCLLEEIENCVFSGFLLRARPKNNNCNAIFIVYLLRSVKYRQKLMRLSTETSRALINSANLGKLDLYLPSRITQDKIAEFLMLVDRRIEIQNKIISKYETLIKGITDSFSNENCLPIQFERLYIKAGEGGTPSTDKHEYYSNGTIPFIKIDDLNSKYITSNKDYISVKGLENSSAWLVPKNSIIFSNGATIGKISINTYPVATKQGVLGIIPSRFVTAEFLYWYMQSKYFRKQVKRITVKGTMDCAYLKDLNGIICHVPSLEKQYAIERLLSSIYKRLEIESLLLDKLKEHKHYLLSKMFI